MALALVVVVASARYVSQTRATGPSMEDLMPGSEAARAREVSILIGPFGESMVEGWRFVQQPGSQAAILIGLTAAAALFCFRIATLIERHAGLHDDDPGKLS
jgi:hypothetical protein